MAMAAVLASWVVVFWLQAGLGYLVVPRLRRPPGPSLFNAFWVGWSVIVAFLQVFQLVLPVGPAAMALLTLAGVVGLVLAMRHLSVATPTRPPGLPAAVREAVPVALGLAPHCGS